MHPVTLQNVAGFYLPVPANAHVSRKTAGSHTLHLGFTGIIHKQKIGENYE